MFWSQALAKSRPCSLNYGRPHDTVAAIRGTGDLAQRDAKRQESKRSGCRLAIGNSSKSGARDMSDTGVPRPSRSGGVRRAYSAYDKALRCGITVTTADGCDQMIFLHRQRLEATLEQAAGLPSPRIEVSCVETALRADDANVKPAGSDGASTRWTWLGMRQ